MTPGSACTALVQRFEGCAKKQADGRFIAYPDPGTGGDPWTIGWGTTGADVKPGVIWTQQQCDDRLAKDVASFAAKVSAVIGGSPTSQNQFDAMVSFAYNVGVTTWRTAPCCGSTKRATLRARNSNSAGGTRRRARCCPA